MAAPGQRDAHRIEQCAFDEDRAGRLIASGGLAADHARDRLHAGLIADRAVLGVDDVVAAVERPDRFATTAPQGQHVAPQFVDVEYMQRPAQIDGEEIRHVDQRVDRPQSDRGQAVLQPLRTWRIAHALNGTPQYPGTRLGELYSPVRAAIDRGPDLRRPERLQGADPGGGEIAGDASDTETIATVRGDADVDDRVVQSGVRRIGYADRRILGQLDDA